jgi:hypothetical protein
MFTFKNLAAVSLFMFGTTLLWKRKQWPRAIATRLWIAIADPGAFVMGSRPPSGDDLREPRRTG